MKKTTKSFLFFFVVTALVLQGSLSMAWADPAGEPAKAEFLIGGTWHYHGNGTINGFPAEDKGKMVVTASGEVGNERITLVKMSGRLVNKTTGQAAPYSISQPTDEIYQGNFTVSEDGLTVEFVQSGKDTANIKIYGRQKSSGYKLSLTYAASRNSAPSPSSGGGGGGCSLGLGGLGSFGFLALLLVPFLGLSLVRGK